MARPKVACCKPRSAQGAARVHWFHRDDCVLLPGREIEPRVKYPSHPAGTAIWEHPDRVPVRTTRLHGTEPRPRR